MPLTFHEMVHHIMSLFGTGASSSQIQQGYDHNNGYQRPAKTVHQQVVQDLQTWDHASAYLGKEQHYPDFLAFFQREIEAKGWEAVLGEYVLAGTDSADDLLVRLYAGFLHPLIQMMYGIEWKQPAIVAEALAQTCVHQAHLKEALLQAEKNADEAYGKKSEKGTMPSLVSLYEEVKNDEKLAKSVKMEDDNKVRDGTMVRAPEEMLRVMSKVKVKPEELEERTVEMFNASLYMAASASFHGEKHNKFDFFLMCVEPQTQVPPPQLISHDNIATGR